MAVTEQTANPLSQFLYALKSPETKRQWPNRLKIVFDFLGLHGALHEQAREFITLYKEGSVTLVQNRIMEFLSYQVQRSHRGEISQATIPNYLKAIKLFCEMTLSLTEVCLLDHARYKILPNEGSFDNFTISDVPDGSFLNCTRTHINNLFYSKTVVSNTQAVFYYDGQCDDHISKSQSPLTPNQLQDILKDLQSQRVSQVREHLKTLTADMLKRYLDLLQEIYQPNGLIERLLQEELQSR
jgi:hypothetical protein